MTFLLMRFAALSQGGVDQEDKFVEDDGVSFFYQLWYEPDVARFETPPKVEPAEDCKYKYAVPVVFIFSLSSSGCCKFTAFGKGGHVS